MKKLALLALVLLTACQQTMPKEALQLSPESLQDRQMQTRKFETTNEKKMLTASAQVLQDLGYTIEESATKLGVITASKDRDATEAGQVMGAIALALLTGVATPIDNKQKFRASIVTRPVKGGNTAVRVTFQRIVWNTRGEVSKMEQINDSEIYKQFFDKLSQSAFIEANEI